MGVYDRQIATAIRLIAKKGETVQWVSEDEVVSGSQPWKTTAGAVVPGTPVKMVFVSAGSALLDAIAHLIPGTSVPSSSIKGLMGAVGFTPAINDMVVRDGVAMMVKDLNIVKPNDQVILYKITFA